MSRTVSLSNYLAVGDVAALDITGTALTISCWVYGTLMGNNNQILISKARVAATDRQYSLRIHAGQVQFQIGDTAGEDVVAAGSLSDSVWFHAAGVKNGTGASGITAYASGAGASASSPRTIFNSTARFTVGQFDDGTYGMNAACRVADLAVWDVALTAAEIAALAKGVSPLYFRRDHLKGYWPLFGVAYPEPDLSGNGNNLTVGGGTVAAANHAPVGRLGGTKI